MWESRPLKSPSVERHLHGCAGDQVFWSVLATARFVHWTSADQVPHHRRRSWEYTMYICLRRLHTTTSNIHTVGISTPGGSLDRRVNLSLHVPAQMGWRDMEHKGGGKRGSCYPAPGGCARSRGYKRSRGRESEPARQLVLPRDPLA
jgi:hypothetical protein